MPISPESIVCEAYGPCGAAVIADCLPDCPERTVARVREVVQAHGGHLGAPGSVSYLFNPVGRLVFAAGSDFKRVIRVAVEAGAEEVIAATREVLTDPIDLENVRAALRSAGLEAVHAELTRRASMTVSLPGPEAVALVHLIAALKKLNDVENVYTNAEIPDEVLALV